MKLRVKFYYITVGYQALAALVFAMFGRLGMSLFATIFAILGWYLAEFSLPPLDEKAAGK